MGQPLVARTKLPPAHGFCRWVEGEGAIDPISGNRYLTINGTDYEVEVCSHGFRLHHLDPETFKLVSYRIECWGTTGIWYCNCPDVLNRPERMGQCKHSRALRAALEKLPL